MSGSSRLKQLKVAETKTPHEHKVDMMQQVEARQTTLLQLALAWSFAGIPLLAGVAQTLVNAMKLFH
jgi:hypothetical protein